MKHKSDIPLASALASPAWSTATGTRVSWAPAPSSSSWESTIHNASRIFVCKFLIYRFWSRTDQTELGEQQQRQTLGVDDEQDHDETPRDDLEENENEFKIRIRIKLAKFRYIPIIPPPRSNLSDVPVDKGDVHEVQDEEAEDGVPSAAEGQEAAGRGADHPPTLVWPGPDPPKLRSTRNTLQICWA